MPKENKNLFLELFTSLCSSVLRYLPAEFAHEHALFALEKGLVPASFLPGSWTTQEIEMALNIPGLGAIEHPVGLAAGFDKDGRTIKSISNIGFAFLEFGTVTPKAQPGNPRPRLWRLKEEKALVNSMGFNNAGIDQLLKNIGKTQNGLAPIGINIGKNKFCSMNLTIIVN